MIRSEVDSREALLPAPGEAWTPIRLSRWSGEYLEGKGIESGRLDAELLLAHVLGIGRLDLYLQFDRPLQPPELKAFKALLLRRGSREPLQYVIGETPFRELDLRTDSRALIPRPETEVLVGEVLAWAGQQDSLLSGLDIGTGSGAIALSLLREGPFRTMVATDSSDGALQLARENAKALDMEKSIEFRLGSLFEPLREGESFNVVACNPPYIPEAERASLQSEVREWEPSQALFAGPEGTDVLLPLVKGVPEFLCPGGLFAAEVGDGQGPKVAQVMEETRAFREVSIRPDLAGRERVVLGVAYR